MPPTTSRDQTIGLDAPNAYLNRRLSWMRFNDRVLALALDERHPLLERLRFLCITASNLDEFVEVRLPDLETDRDRGVESVGPDGLAPGELIELLESEIRDAVDRQYRAFDRLREELRDESIELLRPDGWNEDHRRWAEQLFEFDLAPVVSHTPVHPDRPFPRVFNGAVNLLVTVDRPSNRAAARDVVVRMPQSKPSLVRFPRDLGEPTYQFALLSDVASSFAGRLFPEGRIERAVPFRVTRDTDVDVEPTDGRDRRIELEDELLARPFGTPMRLEIAADAPQETADRLREAFDLARARCLRVPGPLDPTRLEGIVETVDRPDLEYEPFVPGTPGPFRDDDLYEKIEDRDVAVHRPYESFEPFVEFVERAAADPRVAAIKQTVYRTELGSPITDALARAARAGKEVTAVVELRARYDEERNVELADRLRDAGATVVFGPEAHKVHAKMALVVRRQDDTDYRYAHLATGNYHPGMARQYTDIGYFTSDRVLTADVAALFDALERGTADPTLNRMLAAPRTLGPGVVRRIEREIAHAHLDRPGRILGKLNRLTDPEVIRALYRASRAGVQIDLIVRGMCRLRPGVAGLSENIHVRSVVGRFLEHSRAFFFENGGDVEMWISSADWREKNLRRRVEHAVPIDDEDVGKRVARQVFEAYLADDTHAWELQPDGTYRRATPEDPDHPRWAQSELLKQMCRPE